MAKGGYREEVFNVLLALLLHERGVVTAPEKALRQSVDNRRQLPDVMVDFQGLRTVIEGKVDDQANAREKALQQARDRVDKGIAHIGIAVLYPSSLRDAPFPELQNTLACSTLGIAVCSEAGDTDWTEGSLDYLAELLRRTFAQLVKEDVVAKAVAALDAGVSEFAHTVFASGATVDRAAQILGIGEPPKRGRKQAEDDE